MMTFRLPGYICLAALLSAFARGYALNSSIASCGDFDCDERGSGVYCDIGQRQYSRAGSVPLMTTGAFDLSWTIAQSAAAQDPDANSTLIIKDFYIGYPPSINLSSVEGTGCAVFFTASTVEFDQDSIEQPGCPSTLSPACIKRLVKTTSDIASSESSHDLCSRIESEFDNQTVPMECSAISPSSRWTGVYVTGFTGESAPQPPTLGDMGSTTCHPVVPSSFNLSYVLGETFHTNRSGYDPAVKQAVPILTVLANRTAHSSGVSDDGVFVNLTCLTAPNITTRIVQESGSGNMYAPMMIAAWVSSALSASLVGLL